MQLVCKSYRITTVFIVSSSANVLGLTGKVFWPGQINVCMCIAYHIPHDPRIASTALSKTSRWSRRRYRSRDQTKIENVMMSSKAESRRARFNFVRFLVETAIGNCLTRQASL